MVGVSLIVRRDSHWLRCALLAIAWIMAVQPWNACWLPGTSGARAFARIRVASGAVRFEFKIDAKTPERDLLPVPPASEPLPAPWLIKDLLHVPQVQFARPHTASANTLHQLKGKITGDERVLTFGTSGQAGQKLVSVTVQTACSIARINHLNQKDTDHFLKVLLKHRPDLAGLPFLMGDACRMDKKHGEHLRKEVVRVREVLPQERLTFLKLGTRPFQATARLAAMMQILATEDADSQKQLAEILAASSQADATQALVKLALFSFQPEVRQEATRALAGRPDKLIDERLLAGLRYPWPDVARNAADAIVKLKRKNLMPALVDFLDEPDPRAPVARQVDGKEVFRVRELVRINHHQNCLLCHAPGNSPDIKLDGRGFSENVLTATVPIPGQPLPPSSQGYYDSISPDIRIRADITYLRQDFSLLQPVAKAAPWPDKQRFDFLVRTRDITPQEAAAYTQWRYGRGPADLSPNHRAVLDALRTLTGRDAAPSARAWRVALATDTSK